MLLQCNNKDCRRIAEVKLDPDTNEVVCSDCGMPIKNVTEFIKVNLRANKEFVKKKAGSSFNVKCTKCGKMVCPVLNSKDRPECTDCGAEITMSKAFENVFRQSIRRPRK